MDMILESSNQVKEQVIQNTKDISLLKSNVKWIYQYGGVGGSGGSGSVSQDWSLYVSLNDKILNSDTQSETEIILNPNENKNLIIQINKPNGKTYFIDYIKYFDGTTTQDLCNFLSTSKRTLSPGNYKFERNNLNIKGNGEFLIKVSCIEEANDFHTIQYFCINNPISINLNYVIKRGTNYSKVNTIDVNTLKNTEGLYIEIDYTFYTKTGHLYSQILNSSLDIINGEEYYSKKMLSEKSAKIYLQLNIDYDNITNLGYHIFNVNFIIDEDGHEDILNKTISCTIIPNEKYLQVVPTNNTQIIYNKSQNLENPIYTFVSGIHGFNLTAYSGSSQITSNKFDISCIKIEQDDLSNIKLPEFRDFVSENNELKTDTNILLPELSKNISERITNTHQINLVLENPDDQIHLITLSFIIKYNNEFSNIEHFYIYVVKNNETINWYRDEVYNLSFENYKLNYYKNGTCSGDFSKEEFGFNNSQYLQFRKTNLDNQIISFENNISAENNIIHIGLQYSDINNDDDKILTINETNNNYITLYQNKIDIGGISCPIYIPKEDIYEPSNQSKYHLISILKHKLYDDVYSITIYVDGCIENSIDKIYNSQTKFSFTNIITHQSNFCVNLLEISYINNLKITDNDISRYWYAYFDQFISPGITDNEILNSIKSGKLILSQMESFEYTSDNLITIKNTNDSPAFTTIENIALNVNCPVILLDYDNKIDNQYDNFIGWFTRTYGENEKAIPKNVSVYWSSGQEEFGEKINTPTNTSFYIEPQGSSTKNFVSKNLNLGIQNTSERPTIPVFTPNFDINNTNSFLPESKYTLKTDIIDSSHSNNTSMGKFINSNTKKFAKASESDQNSIYVHHIKNCLTGFPILVFIKVRIDSPKTPDQPDIPEYFKFYYLGIYNFNLGRDSYFNMGYYPLTKNNEEIFSDDLKNNNGKFRIFDINTDSINYKDGLFITEVQNGDPYFDFSQYHESILFQGNKDNKKYMFGDFVPEIYSDKPQDNGTLNATAIGSKNKQILTNLLENIAITGGLLFKKIGKNFGPQEEKYNSSVNMTDRIYDSKNQVPDFRKQWIYNFNPKDNEPQYTLYEVGSAKMSNLFNADPLGYLNNLIKYESSEETDQTEYIPWIDYRSLIEYYVICMVFGLVDSVQKNLNLKTWNAFDILKPATFYTAFYDMDTCLGRDNGGAEVKYFAFSDYWKSVINQEKLSEISIYRDFYPSRTENSPVPIGYDIPSSYLFAIAKYARISGINGEFANTKYPSANMIYAMWRSSSLGPDGKGSLQNSKYFVENYFDTLKPIPTALINHNYRFKYLIIENNNGSYSFSTLNKKPFHGRGKYSVIEWLSNRLRLLDAYFNLSKINTKVQKYDIDTDTWSIVKNSDNIDDSNNLNLSLNEFNSGNELYEPDNNNSDIYILSDIFGKTSKINKDIYLTIQSKQWSPIVITSPMSTQQFLVPEENKNVTINVKMTGNNQLTLGGSQYWTYIDNLGAFVENVGLTVTSKNLTNISLSYAIDDKVSSWVFNTPSVETISLNNPNYSGILKNVNNNNVDQLLNLNSVSLANSGVSLQFLNNGFSRLDISGTLASQGIIINSCPNFKELIYDQMTNISELNISSIWSENIILKNFTCQSISIGSNESIKNASITIDNIQELKSLKLIGNFKTIKILNCVKLQEIILPNTVETLILNNVLLDSFTQINSDDQNSSIRSNNITYEIDQNLNLTILNISYLQNLQNISFEETQGFDIIKLPNKDINLLSKAFYNTDLQYIDFEGNPNTENMPVLTLCDNGKKSDIDVECSIFDNSAFTLLTSYNQNLKFKVKENTTTSLVNLFHLNKQSFVLNVHSGVPNLTYSIVNYFIRNLENKDKVVSFKNAFYRQSNISAKYNIKNNTYYDPNTVDQNNNVKLLDNKELLTLDGYTNLSDISGMLEHTSIDFVNNSFFGNCAQNVNIFNLVNFISYKNIKYIHFNAFDNIKSKIIEFLFSGSDDESNLRKAIFTIYNDEQDPYTNSYILPQVNLHNFIFTDSKSQLKSLTGFNILNVMDFEGLFTDNENSITSIQNIFTNINQSIIVKDSNVTNSIQNLSLSKLSNLEILDSAFESIDILKTTINNDKLINILTYLDWETQYFKLTQSNTNLFKFYKSVNLTNENSIKLWNNLWNMLGGLETTTNVNYLFSKTTFIMNKTENDTYQPLEIPFTKNNKPLNINNAINLFSDSTCYTYDSNTELLEETGILLSENTLKSLKNVISISGLFKNCVLNAIDQYPIPENLFSELSSLTNISSIFENTILIGNHKTYKTLNDGYHKELYYQLINKQNGSLKNYSLSDEYYTSSGTIDENGIISTGYEFIPHKLFENNINLSNISNAFANSDFEGYISDQLFIHNKNLSSITNFIKNCKILPQLYKQFNNQDDISEIYNPDSLKDSQSNINGKAFVFIPGNIFNLIQSFGFSINNLFTFNLLISSTPNIRLYLMTNETLKVNNQIKSTGNIQLNTNNDSKIINKWYINDDNTQYNILDALNGDNNLIQNKIVYSVINLCINKEGENKYSEGITYKMFYNNSGGISLINEELASIYYGYIFKKNTLIYNTETTENNNLAFVQCNKQLINPLESNRNVILGLSNFIIFPSIIIYNEINSQYLPINMYTPGITKPNSLYNKLYKNCLLSVNTSVINISSSQLNIINLDLWEFSQNKQEINGKYQYTCKAKYENYELSEVKILDNENDNILEEYKNKLRTTINNLIFSNYIMLFNNWEQSVIQISGNKNTGTGILSTYNKVNIIDSENQYYTVKSSENIILARNYILNCIVKDNVIYINQITTQ